MWTEDTVELDTYLEEQMALGCTEGTHLLPHMHKPIHPSDYWCSSKLQQVLYFSSSQSTFVEGEREADSLPVGRSRFEDEAQHSDLRCRAQNPSVQVAQPCELRQPLARAVVTPSQPSGSAWDVALYMCNAISDDYFMHERQSHQHRG